MGQHRIFVANRGEIALRILQACDRLGVETVIGTSSADAHSLAARRADRAITIGGPHPHQSYLNAQAVIHAAVSSGCTALHPGYGFLSERADFARMCEHHDLIFIGPKADQLDALGDKLSARKLAQSVGVPVSPGGPTQNPQQALELAHQIGYPLLIKAAYGGGGRGMKLVFNDEQLTGAWLLASSEALSAFGDGTVFVERFIQNAKHVEVQILGDGKGNLIHLGERECSMQYRYQKMIEEAPCSVLTPQLRDQLHEYALRIGKAINFVSLGTVEFLYDTQRKQFCFLEVNPRVQVEHPVTESVTGVDLVREQICIAIGQPLSLQQNSIECKGHAIELRLTAQDPAQDLRPTPGRLQVWRPVPIGGVRWDTHLTEGELFPPYYDALMAKIIAWGVDRSAALERARQSIARLQVRPIVTNQNLLVRLLDTPEMIDNTITTHWLGDYLKGGVAP